MLVTDRNWVRASWVVEAPGHYYPIEFYIHSLALGISVSRRCFLCGVMHKVKALLAGVNVL